jgi:pimeloyl-ACP methyl ester carboxylesterase
VRLLRRRRDILPQRIGLFAASQSGWIAPIVASREPGAVAFVAMISGPGTTLARTVLYEAEMELRSRGFAPDQIRAGVEAKAAFERLIVSGASDDKLDAVRSAVAKEPWFPHVGILPRGHWYRAWWGEVGRFDPSPYWRRVRCPVLNLYGDQDVELPVAQSVRAMNAAFAGSRSRQLTQHIFAGADHSLSIRRGLRPVRAPGVMDMLTNWVQQRARS